VSDIEAVKGCLLAARDHWMHQSLTRGVHSIEEIIAWREVLRLERELDALNSQRVVSKWLAEQDELEARALTTMAENS
jgi:hypothetical protein